MIEVSPISGDTLFAKMVAALESLSAPMQQRLADLTAVHSGEQTYRGYYNRANDEGQTYSCLKHLVV